MFDYFKMIFRLLNEAVREGKLIDIYHDQVWNRRIAIPVEMDLCALPPWKDNLQEQGYRFIELTMNHLQSDEWAFFLPSRRYKALRNLKRGLRGFALIKDSKVVGDIWCITPQEGKPVAFRDLDMLGIECKAGDAYAFDMLVDPESRGKNLAVPFQHLLYHALKLEGIRKMYGFYWEDNIPAMWMHRMLKFKELPKRRVSRLFIFFSSRAEINKSKNHPTQSDQTK